MANDVKFPFTDDDLASMKENLELLKTAESILAKGRQAGFDLSDKEKEIAELKGKIRRIQQTFFPGQG